MSKKVITRFKQPRRPIFLRQWRKHRDLTQQQVAEAIGISRETLSRVETGKIPYSQGILEGAAERLNTDVASLLMRDPTIPEPMWSIWELAKPGEREMIVEIARTIVKTGARPAMARRRA